MMQVIKTLFIIIRLSDATHKCKNLHLGGSVAACVYHLVSDRVAHFHRTKGKGKDFRMYRL